MKERFVCIERGDWKRAKKEVYNDGTVGFEKRLFVFFFDEIGECVQVEFVEMNRLALGGEGCGSDVAQGSPQFRGGQKPHVRLQSMLRFCRGKALVVQESFSHV